MNIISYLLEPIVFMSVLAGLFVISMLVIFSLMRKDNKINQEIEGDIKKDKIRIGELEAILVQNKEEHRQKVSQLEESLKNKEEELKKHIKEQGLQLEEQKQLKSVILKLEAQVKEKESLLKQEIYAKGDLSKKIEDLEGELAKSKRELSLSNQMYEGLKGQYNELEKNLEKLAQQLEEEQSKPKKEVGLEKSNLPNDSDKTGSESTSELS